MNAPSSILLLARHRTHVFVRRRALALLLALALASLGSGALAQDFGGVRGRVFDADFDEPLAEALVTIAETGRQTLVTEEGNFVFEGLEPGIYTLVFSKEGYARRVKGGVVVQGGRMTELEESLYGEFTDMEEFVVEYAEAAATGDLALLELRMESPALMDSIGADMMSMAGASDAAGALNLVSGTTVADGKYAVVRGLPDRYVSSQLNGVRLPTADEDKRAVELDLFPSAVIDSVQVTKTFTPDQQGDASGGAVNVMLKGIPDETILKLDLGGSFNTEATGRSDFPSYDGGGVGAFGFDDGGREIPLDLEGENWPGAVGVSSESAPYDGKWGFTAGGKRSIADDVRIGGLVNFFYQRDSSYQEGTDDRYWVESPGEEMTPQTSQGSPEQGDFKTSLFDVRKGSREVKWGGLGVVGIETERNSISLLYLYTRVAEDSATLAQDTRGKSYYFPGYDADDPEAPGNLEPDAAPWLRTETLEYSERTASTLQLSGRHELPFSDYVLGRALTVLPPVVDWSVSHSRAGLDQPDKRQFGSLFQAEAYNPGFPPFVDPFTTPEVQRPFKPGANFTLGNLQRVWKEIDERSMQYALNAKLPFTQWSGDEGYLKFGRFHDRVNREYNQDSYSNFNDNQASYEAPWDDPWSEVFPDEDHPITAGEIDVDYEGDQDISAWYGMADLPLTSWLKLIGGARLERTELSIVNFPESEVTWIPPGAPGAVTLNPGDADVAFEQSDLLPSIGFELKPHETVKIFGSYSQTIARQTFKELTPIQQQEFLGGDVFIGNPSLQPASVKNYDLRIDYTPFEGSLVSASYFYKDISDPIEYVQRVADFAYTTAVNYPKGRLSGIELEARQQIGRLWDPLEGLTLGGNATFIDSEVTLPADEAALFDQPNIDVPTPSRRMTGAPDRLYNLYASYDMERIGLPDTQVSLFYTVKGDTLVAGAGQSAGHYIPDVFEASYGTLNFSLSRKLNEWSRVRFQAKNLLDPAIETVYRSDAIGEDVTKTSYRKGMEFTVDLTLEVPRREKLIED